ncbi:MAG: hypothetical protein LUE64_06720 [Candidatus Gastranaerophilales bacterium]|nr:hypothetical protein [Candidatus Gastranaerophilales bacterium]
MGMAASQARFLSLTARKSNVEYEGQQVNQQRTALANESANLYSKLTALDVPTPPSTSDYYTTVYTFSTSELDNTSTSSTSYTLENIYSTVDGTYASLSYTSYAWQSAVTSAYAGNINTTYDSEGNASYSVALANGSTYDATKYTYQPSTASVSFTLTDNKVDIGDVTFSLDDTGNTITGTDSSGNSYSYSVTDNGDGTYSMSVSVEEQDDDSYTVTIGGTSYPVTYDSSTGEYTCEITNTTTSVSGKYADENGNSTAAVSYLSDDFLSANGASNQPILAYTIGDTVYYISAEETASGEFASSSYVQSVGTSQTVEYPCTYTTASSGRYSTLTVTDDNGNSYTFSLNVESVQDEDAYDQAMLDYEYEQAQYEKEVADINAKTESIQQQDKVLELRLKQLDTEQDALATEMDSVSQVIEDNIESTFNTFA